MLTILTAAMQVFEFSNTMYTAPTLFSFLFYTTEYTSRVRALECTFKMANLLLTSF